VNKKIRFDIIRTRNIWFIFSLVVVGIGVVSLFTQKLNLGVDFTGGRIIRFEAGRTVTTDEIDSILEEVGISAKPAQILTGGREFIVRTESYAEAEDLQGLESKEQVEKAREFRQKVHNLKIEFNIRLFDLDPDNFTLWRLDSVPSEKTLDGFLDEGGLDSVSVQIKNKETIPGDAEGDPPTYNVTIALKNIASPDQMEEAARVLYAKLNAGFRSFEQEDEIDPVFGLELKKKAYIALLIATIGILLYVTVRFEFWFAVAAIIALIHDCLITLGFYSLLQLRVNSAFVAIILTVFGYSINDTIIIFDRIRENMRKDKKAPLDRVINSSLWETMPRSINTMATTEITLLAILVLGGSSIKDFALGLGIGIFAGTYSSIMLAAPLAFLFKSFDKKRGGDERIPSAAPPSRPKKSAKKAAPKEEKEEAKPKKGAAPAGSAPKTAPAHKKKKKSDSKKKGKKQRRR